MPRQTRGDECTGTGVQPLPLPSSATGGDRVRVPGRVAMGGDGEPVPAGIAALTRHATKALLAALGAAGRTLETR